MDEFEIRKAALEAAVRTVAGRRAESDDARVDAVLEAADRYEVWLSQDLRVSVTPSGECSVCEHAEHDQGKCTEPFDIDAVGVRRCPCLASRTLSTAPVAPHAVREDAPENESLETLRREYREAMIDPGHACSDLTYAIPGCSCIDLYRRAYPNGIRCSACGHLRDGGMYGPECRCKGSLQ